ncbi:MAG: Hsp20/alpha crystallin family protein [Nitrospirae bacterium]|nr:MAG: Hsp20/alpha crystallin family protein [Nitrospirota bacterium]
MALRDLIPRRHGRTVPVRREEASPFAALHEEMDRLFDDFFRSFDWWPFERFASSTEGYLPRVDVAEDEENVVVTAELPGLEEKDIEVSLAGGVLTLKGEKREESETRDKEYVRTERSFGAFRRSIPLPCEVEEDKVKATFKRGVLTVTLPKSEAARRETRRIPVEAA